MYHTTDVTALGFILSKLTLRCSSLLNANLNDKMEKERVGVSQFAGSRFIVCFSHKDHENVHFWCEYGGDNRQNKVLIKFNNFATHLLDLIHTDYCLLENGQKVFFDGEVYHKTINQNGLLGTMLGMQRINEDFDLRNCISSIEMFDVEYLPFGDEAFTKDYSSNITVDFSAENITAIPSELSGIKAFSPNCLGKQKSNPWEIESESRILFTLHQQDFSEWPFIDLRLKEEIFRDMTIVLSPWLAPDLEDRVRKIVAESPISTEIKKTIQLELNSIAEATGGDPAAGWCSNGLIIYSVTTYTSTGSGGMFPVMMNTYETWNGYTMFGQKYYRGTFTTPETPKPMWW